MKYAAICFDLDGVIVNSEPLHAAAFQSALEQYDLQLSGSDYETYFAGKTDERGFIDYLSQQQAKIPLPGLLALKQQAFASLAPTELAYYDGLPGLIKDLSRVIPLGLVTGSSLEETEIALKPRNLEEYFSTIVTARDITQSKPSPEGYLLAASQFVDSIALEDSPSGVLAAKNAGMYCIAVTNTHTAKQLEIADMVVERLSPATFMQLVNA